MEMVIKEKPSTGRLALLEAFVDAHFDPETGEPACGGFFEVLKRLGRKDLNFGPQAQELGRLSTEEETFVRDMHSDRCDDARKAARKKNFDAQFPPISYDCRANPFYKQLSAIERLVFEALSPDGKGVVNPAAATTLAQAVHERWFEVPYLPFSPTELLKHSCAQGDAHAAYLLATLRTEDDAWLEKSAEKRKSYLDRANRLGHQGAYHTLLQADMEDMDSDFRNADQTEWFLDELMDQLQLAKKRGPTAEGEALVDMGIQLDDASYSLMIHGHPDFPNFSAYQGQHEIALGWIKKAAATSTRAKHWLATSPLLNRLEVAERIDLLSAAAWPESDASPFYPALVDLAEIYAKVGSSTSNADKARACLAQAIDTIKAPEPLTSIRLADLDEQLNAGLPSNQAYEHYASAAKSSAYAAFRAGVLALRKAMVCGDRHVSLTHFEACVQFETEDDDELTLKAKLCAEAALLIGWGDFNSNGRWNNDAWNNAAVVLVQHLDRTAYRASPTSLWLLEEDIKILLDINPHYRQLMKLRFEFNGHEELHRYTKEFSVLHEYAYGASDPLIFLQGIVSISTKQTISLKELNQKREIKNKTLLEAFLAGQLYLNGRVGDVDVNGQVSVAGQVLALEHFERAELLINQPQLQHGCQGSSKKSDLLRWLGGKTWEGILQAQPNGRSLDLGSALCGPMDKFGTQMMKKIQSCFKDGKLPGTSPATNVIYRDRFINTPFNVAQLAFWMLALQTYLQTNRRWEVERIEIETLDEDKKPKSRNNVNPHRWSDQWQKSATRDEVLYCTMKQLGVNGEVMSNIYGQHDRELIVKFLDGSKLRLGLGHGLDYWKPEPCDNRNIHFDFSVEPDKQVMSIVDAKVKVKNEDSKPAIGHLEWIQNLTAS